MTAERNQIAREKILNDYPSLRNLLDDQLLIEVEACEARARELVKMPEDALRMRSLSANMAEIKERLRRFKTLVENHSAGNVEWSEKR